MKPKSTLILDNEFIQYCELNEIVNIEKLAQETFARGFSLLKYGETPNGNRVKEIVEVQKEVIKEIKYLLKGNLKSFKNNNIDTTIDKSFQTPIPFANVKILNLKIQTKTDINGNFSFIIDNNLLKTNNLSLNNSFFVV